MKKISLAVLVAFCFATFLTSCDPKKEDPKPKEETPKPDPNPVDTTSRTVLLTNKVWVMKTAVVSPEIKVDTLGLTLQVTDLFAAQVAGVAKCVTDDELEFKAVDAKAVSGAFSRKANTKCSNETDQTGNWAFNNDQTQIIASNGDETTTTFNIIAITDKMLKVTLTLMNPLDASDKKVYTVNSTFEPK